MDLPLTPDGVTREWLTFALGERFPGVLVESFIHKQTMWGTGAKIMIEVGYNDVGSKLNLPAHLCVKGGFADHRAAYLFLYQLEARFFAELAPRLAVGVPRCLYAGADANQGVVIMEDLTTTGAQICRVQAPLTRERAMTFIDGLASLHAAFWDSPELEDPRALGWLVEHDPLPDDDWGAYGRGQLEPDTWARYMELPRALAIPAACRDRDTMKAALQALRRYTRGKPRCLIHADAHLGNLFIDGEGRACFLDWQTARKGHWAQDVTYFLVSALDQLDRRAWEQDLMRHYLNGLSERGVRNAPTEVQAWEAFRAHVVYGLFYWLMNPVEWQAEVNNAAVAPRFAWAAIDHGSPPIDPPSRRTGSAKPYTTTRAVRGLRGAIHQPERLPC